MTQGLAHAYELLELADKQKRDGDLEGAMESLGTALEVFREHAKTDTDFREYNLPNIEAQRDELGRLREITGQIAARLAQLPAPVLQTDLFKELPAYDTEDVRWAMYYAAKSGDVVRVKQGRTYSVELARKGNPR